MTSKRTSKDITPPSSSTPPIPPLTASQLNTDSKDEKDRKERKDIKEREVKDISYKAEIDNFTNKITSRPLNEGAFENKDMIVYFGQFIEFVDPDALTYHGNANYYKTIKEFTLAIGRKLKLDINDSFYLALEVGIHLNLSGPGNANQKIFKVGSKKIILSDLFALLGFKNLAKEGGKASNEYLKEQINKPLTSLSFISFLSFLSFSSLESVFNWEAVKKIQDIINQRAPGKAGKWVEYANYHILNKNIITIDRYIQEKAEGGEDLSKIDSTKFSFTP